MNALRLLISLCGLLLNVQLMARVETGLYAAW